MPRFIVSVQWMMVANVEVEASNIDEAMSKVRETFAQREKERGGFGRALPRFALYLDDSFEVNEDLTRDNAEERAFEDGRFPNE